MSFSRQPCPVWLFTDLEGNILDDNYYMHFLENTIPYLPKDVYQDDQALAILNNPLQFHPDGTLPNNLYFEDGTVYRLEVRRGQTQSDPLIRLIENFVTGNGADPTDAALAIDNQITNPQFAFISFTSPYVITNTGNNSYDIAPGWVLDLESVGSVTVTVSRVAITGADNIPDGSPTNPSYALSIEVTSGTLTSSKLRQRFDHAPAIWASQGLSINFTGKMLNNNAAISVSYVPSNSTASPTGTIVVSDTLSTAYQFISGGVQLPASDSTDTGDDGYVDIVFTLPISGTTFLTNIQAIGSAQAASYPYSQTTVERQLDQTFHIYKESLLRQPKQNLLTGWNFGINPWQFADTAPQIIAAQTSYITDQTILYQETASALQVGRAAYNLNYGLQLAAINGVNANRFAIIQYIDVTTMAPYWGQIVSCLVKAGYIHTTGALAVPEFKMRLIWRTSAVPAISSTNPISSIDANGDPVFAAGWNSITPLNDVAFTLTELDNGINNNTFPSLPFDKFRLPTPTGGSIPLYSGVVIYINKPLNNALGFVDYVVFDKVSLTDNDFAIDAATETYDESLRKCQFYYEKSYNPSVLPGAVTSTGLRMEKGSLNNNGGVIGFPATQLEVKFQQVKCKTPTMTFYSSASNTPNRARIAVFDGVTNPAPIGGVPGTNPVDINFTTFWGVNFISLTNAQYQSTATTVWMAFGIVGSLNLTPAVYYHYTADSRLGM